MDKQHILKEIKRTTNANGGRPLGVMSFYTKTGIKESDWKAKYWLKWSDAVREAGFEPTNRMITATDETELIGRFIRFIRELGHFPVDAELRMKAYTSPTFPSTKTFRERLGTKPALAAKVKAFCESRAGYEDIIEMCAAIVKDQLVSDGSTKPEECSGIIYLMKSGRYYKIGFTHDIARREREIKIELPEKLETVHWFRTDDASGVEAYWKNRFKAKRRNGEWFDLAPQDVRAFKRRKTFM